MTEFEKLTASPQALAAFLRGLSVIEAPWDAAFQKRYCTDAAATKGDAQGAKADQAGKRKPRLLDQKAG